MDQWRGFIRQIKERNRSRILALAYDLLSGIRKADL